MRKKVDERIRKLVEHGVKARHRSMFVIIGDKGHYQVVNLHYMLTKATVKARPKVLWCYEKDLLLSSHKEKRKKQLKKKQNRSLDPIKDDPFSLFVGSTEIRYCYYSNTEKILGNTYGMCVLQDFQALTPNVLARAIETVEGGGLVVFLINSLKPLSSLCTMVKDVHARFRTESNVDIVGRFNERFILSLASCTTCVILDDELNILPVSSHIEDDKKERKRESLSEAQKDLECLKEQLRDNCLVGPLIGKCRTLDQGKAVITFLDAILDKASRSTVALTSSRGRGKSAALGLAVAGAIAAGCSNIFVTAPNPENLKTLFDFVVFKGFDALEYKEHTHYDLVRSTNPAFNNAIIRVNVYKNHQQTIEYIHSQDYENLARAELLIIDEAAAISLPVVKALLCPRLVFLCSTVYGYEGTGRSLSLKLIQQFQEQSQKSGKVFRKLELDEPIRYAAGDPIEYWLNKLLCLDAANYISNIDGRLPLPSECQLYYVNRDALFSYNAKSEDYLQRMMALYMASFYKYSPNDLQLMSDSPAHHLFVLLGPVDEMQIRLPDVLCVIQVCLEGQITKDSVLKSLSDGYEPSGDQIPGKVSEQFNNRDFPSLSGIRIVRIAVHPNVINAGYGSVAVKILQRYYEGELTDLTEVNVEEVEKKEQQNITEAAKKVSLMEEQSKPRSNLPHLFVGLHERPPEKLHYMGVSFGLTQQLYKFWKKHNFVPFYICQIPCAITGEHTCMMLKTLQNDEIENKAKGRGGFFESFHQDFRCRFIHLLGSSFRSFAPTLALSILDPKISFSEQEIKEGASAEDIFGKVSSLLWPIDMNRLESYTNHLQDYHLILDNVFSLAHFYFLEMIPASLTSRQAAILLCMGLQYHDIDHVEAQGSQYNLALFNKVIKKLYGQLHKAKAKEVESSLPRVKQISMRPHNVSVDEDLTNAAKEVKEVMDKSLKIMLNSEDLQQYTIEDRDTDFEAALQNSGGKISKSGLISVKAEVRNRDKGKGTEEKKHSKRKGNTIKVSSVKKKLRNIIF